MEISGSDAIPGVLVKKLARYNDSRGWLMECFREDEIGPEISPAMSYISMTNPGVARGPHEHIEQTDYFCFTGSSVFKMYLWDNRVGATNFQKKISLTLNEGEGYVVIVPPGVVHAYQNIGDKPGLVLNFPNKLFAGKGKKEKIDEVRHENVIESPFKLDEVLK
jgi:dTDP-4-dehydrorhamnose 3,5-epimerase